MYLKWSSKELKMTSKNKIEVIKVPLGKTPENRPQVFSKMPRLYLELIENKTKIKQDMLDTEYVHDYEKTPCLEPVSPANSDSSYESNKTTREDTTQQDLLGSGDEASVLSTNSKESYRSSNASTVSGDDSDNETSPSPGVDRKLDNLLGVDSDDDSVETIPIKKRRDKYSKHRDRKGHSISKKTEAPSFAELQEKGAYIPRRELRDINNIETSEKEDEDMKRELLFKFELLRKSYPHATIPEYSVHTEYKMMISSYEDCVRRLSIDSSVESYKQYLIYGFMGMEFVLGKFLKLDMEGFTQQQMISMNSYEKLLIELGEKSYIPEGSEWSVEVRLLFLVLMNTAFFVVSKMIMKKTSVNLVNMMNNMTGGGVSNDSTKQKRKMRGPDIDIDDIP